MESRLGSATDLLGWSFLRLGLDQSVPGRLGLAFSNGVYNIPSAGCDLYGGYSECLGTWYRK